MDFVVWKFLVRMFDSYFNLLLLMLQFGLVGDVLNRLDENFIGAIFS